MAIKNNYKIIDKEKMQGKEKNVLIIGSGPAGLTCAAFLKKSGYKVTIYEKKNYLGGILRHGIPEFRLPKSILDNCINQILSLGINVKLNMELGKDYKLEEVEDKFDAIFLSIGANKSLKMNIEGENLVGVYGANELLENQNHPDYKGKNVAIIGGGNVAMDASRTIKRLGAKSVTVIYRRAKEQMPAEPKELLEAKDENISFMFQTNIVKILGKDKVEKIECVKTELIKKEGEVRAVPVNIEGSNFEIEMDYVVMAVGSHTEQKVLEELSISLSKRGYVLVNEKYMTSRKKVFAGGDLAGTKATVAWAARNGRDAALEIAKFLEEN